MAVITLWSVGEGYKKSIRYITDPRKTTYDAGERESFLDGENTDVILFRKRRKIRLTHGVGCSAYNAGRDFENTKRFWRKKGGVEAYHIVQSFSPGEGDPLLIHRIGLELAQKMFGGKFETVISTHMDKRHLHNHFIVNSVSISDGRKYKDEKRAYHALRDESDRLCRKYSLSVIDEKNHMKKDYIEYAAERKGEYTLRSSLIEILEYIIPASRDMEDFYRCLSKFGFSHFEKGGKEYYEKNGTGGKVSAESLGKEYCALSVAERIRQNIAPARIVLPGSIDPSEYFRRNRLRLSDGRNDLRELFETYIKAMEDSSADPKEHFGVYLMLREEMYNIGRYKKILEFLKEKSIKSGADLEFAKADAGERLERAVSYRKELHASKERSKRRGDVTGINEASRQLETIGGIIRKARSEIKAAEYAERYAGRMKERLNNMEKGMNKAKEKQIYGQQFRSGRDTRSYDSGRS